MKRELFYFKIQKGFFFIIFQLNTALCYYRKNIYLTDVTRKALKRVGEGFKFRKMEKDTTESKTVGLQAALENLIGARRESNGVVIFNPKEWPKFLVIVLALLVGYYLFNILKSLADFNNYDFIFGLLFLLLFTLGPVIWAVYKLIRDRNDYVQIDGHILSYKDNALAGEIDLNTVVKITGKRDIKFELENQSYVTIKLSQMNFNEADRNALVKEIQLRLSKLA